MKRFLVALAAIGVAAPALAADLPPKPLKAAAPAPAVVTGPFYLAAFAGGGFSATESELTSLGIPQGPLKAYPTGFLAGGEFGARWNTGLLTFGLSARLAYDFSRGAVGGLTPAGGLGPIGSRKNGLLLMEGGDLGINLSTLGGYVPGSAQPSNWPIPVNVPASVWSNLNLEATGGLAHRQVTLCSFDMSTGADDLCASKFITGPYVGARLAAMISAQTELRLEYDHVFWNTSFTPLQATSGIFDSTTRAKGEDLWTGGLAYHF
jgi:hypothetical protein